MSKIFVKISLFALIIGGILSSCSDNDSNEVEIKYPDKIETEKGDSYTNIKGFYLINEGNMSKNNSSLDYYDSPSGYFLKNIFSYFNPSVTNGLGDTANDIEVYKDKAYIVVDKSNKVLVLDAKTSKEVASIDLTSPRSIAFEGNYAYVTSWSNLANNADSNNGSVAKINLTTNQIESFVSVGYAPEGLVVKGSRLYVANSSIWTGSSSLFDNKVSVIDLESFTVTKSLEVAPNLTGMVYDPASANIYVISAGDYGSNLSKLCVISNTDQISFIDTRISGMTVSDGILYIYGKKDKTAFYTTIDTETNTISTNSFINEEAQKQIVLPYSIAINPETKDIYITDAKDYVSPGSLYCFDSKGNRKWAVVAGINPSKIAFNPYQLEGLK